MAKGRVSTKDFGDLDLSEIELQPMPIFEQSPLPSFDEIDFNAILGGLGDGEPGGSSQGIPNTSGGGGFNLGSLFGSAGSTLGSIARGLLGSNQDGSLNLSSLIPLLGLAGGALNANRATGQASEQLQAAAGQARDDANRLIGGARDDFKPYQAAGTDALARMQAAPPSALAGNFGPIGQASGLADKFKQLTLANLARR